MDEWPSSDLAAVVTGYISVKNEVGAGNWSYDCMDKYAYPTALRAASILKQRVWGN